MRIATGRVRDVTRCFLVEGETAHVTDLSDGREAIAIAADDPAALLDRVVEQLGIDDVEVLAPILRPGKILGSGINYASHKEENPTATMPTEPGFFSKFPSSVIGPDANILLPSPGSQVDYEVELAIVIGRPGRTIARGDAMDHVFGYTVINDVSARDVQFRAHQMDLGKGFDTFCPMGPWIVTRDEVPDPAAVRVRSWVNGELRQDASTSEWLYSVAELVEHASRYITLEAGDLVSTGTPAGCGTFRNPPLWLAPGDEVIVEASGVGRLRNRVVAGW